MARSPWCSPRNGTCAKWDRSNADILVRTWLSKWGTTVTAEPARQTLVTAMASGSDALDNFVVRGEAIAEAAVARFDLVGDMAATVTDDVQTRIRALTQKQF